MFFQGTNTHQHKAMPHICASVGLVSTYWLTHWVMNIKNLSNEINHYFQLGRYSFCKLLSSKIFK
jgi:hypothetical protein